MNFLKKNWILISIIFLALFLRINADLFSAGYVFDEIAIVSIAKNSFPFGILYKSAILDYHAPLYYLVIHFLTYLDEEWIYIRLLNIIFSTLNIIVFYLIGKNLKNKTLGYILALYLAVNHLQISTVSFVKFYCLDFLLVSLCILYFIKYFKNERYYLKFSIFNLLFILSWTFGFVFVFLEYLILYLNNKNKSNLLKSFLLSFVGFGIYLPILVCQAYSSLNNIFSPHALYPNISIFQFYTLINDFFSPLINYSCSSETVEANSLLLLFLKNLIYKGAFDFINFFGFLIFSFAPVFIALIGIYLSHKKNSTVRYSLLLCVLFIVFFVVLTLFEITGLIPIYLFSCGIILIICSLYGINELKNKHLKWILILYLVFIQLIITNYYPIEKREDSKHKLYLAPIKYAKNLDKNTILVTTIGGRFLKEYLNDKNVFDFDYERVGGSFKRDYIEKIYGIEISNKANKNNSNLIFGDYILNNKKNPEFEKFILDNLINKLNKGDKIVLAFYADDTPFCSDNYTRKTILSNKNYVYHYENSSLLFLLKKPENPEYITELDVEEAVTSYSNELLAQIFDKYLKRTQIQQYRINNAYSDYDLVLNYSNFPKTTVWIMENFLYGWVFVTYQK